MNERQKDGSNRVSFVECHAFSKSAENIARYFKKGQQILVEGRLQQQTWNDKKTNENRSKLIVLLEHWEFVGSKNDNAGDNAKQEATKVNTAQSDYIEDEDVPF
jgi:single-strand DNA-binding protein